MFEYLNTKEEKIKYCLNKSPEDLRQYIPKAFDFYTDELGELFCKESAHKIIQLAGFMATEIDIKKEKYSKDLFMAISPENIISSEESLEKISHLIKKLRKEIFGKEEPPFNWDEAIDWIENEGKKDKLRNQQKLSKHKEEVKKLRDRIFDLSDEYNDISSDRCLINFKLYTIPYPSKSAWRNVIPVFKNTSLSKLEQETRMIAKETNFSQISLIMVVLTGIKPISIAYKISKSISFGKKTNIKIEINRALNYREFMALFHELNNFLKPKKKQFNKKHLEIYEFIEKNGGIPTEKKMNFWGKKWKEWNESFPNEKYESPDCLRVAWHRIRKQLKERNNFSIDKLD